MDLIEVGTIVGTALVVTISVVLVSVRIAIFVENYEYQKSSREYYQSVDTLTQNPDSHLSLDQEEVIRDYVCEWIYTGTSMHQYMTPSVFRRMTDAMTIAECVEVLPGEPADFFDFNPETGLSYEE